MFHVYEEPAAPADRLAVLSDRDWELLTAPQRAAYRLRAGGFGTGLEAVSRMQLAVIAILCSAASWCRNFSFEHR
ncbi:hypothetical protein R5W23_001337 [Gemmata sp. JC673]|uniref:Uncharacterized protein n=1 Tax=Gemmata algarum TaxID=2975278 RepID=A0ABU5EZS8_9BACT|nr:hypothetical protein [Gemmata algarum]MDY3560112.1 hypothetical protein [Gemmata algarum]